MLRAQLCVAALLGLAAAARHETTSFLRAVSCVVALVNAAAAALCGGKHRGLVPWAHVMGACVQPGVWVYHLLRVSAESPSTLAAAHFQHWTFQMRFCACLVFTWCHQGYACKVLPLWVRLLLAEVHTMSQWACFHLATDLNHGVWRRVASLATAQLSGVVLPLTMAHYLQSRQTTTTISLGSDTAPNPPTSSGRQVQLQKLRKPGDTGLFGQLHQEDILLADAIKQRPDHDTPRSCSQTSQSQAYASPLGERFTISIKISTRHTPRDLAPGSLDKLGRLLEGSAANSSRSRCSMVLSASVREGCILLGLELTKPAGSPASTADEVLEFARLVLPQLLSELGLVAASDSCSSSKGAAETPASAGPQVQPGDTLTLQLGHHTVCAAWDATTCQWLLDVQTEPQPAIRPCLGLAWPLVPHTPPAAAVSPGYTLSFTVQLSDCSDPATVAGVNPAKSAALTANPGVGVAVHQPVSNALQLWVKCQGQYVATTVHLESSSADWLSVTATVPSTALARHHEPAGPIAQLQTATVELWQGSSTLLSTTPLLWDTTRHLEQPIHSGFGWWGASGRQVTACMQELAAAHDPAASAPGHQAFLSDLAEWLRAVQQYAPGGVCPMLLNTPADLSLQQCAAVASSLQHHTAAHGLHGLHALIATQHAAVLQAIRPRNGVQRVAGWATHTVHMQQQCVICRQLLYDGIRQHTRLAQLVSGLTLALYPMLAMRCIMAGAPWPAYVLQNVSSALRILTSIRVYTHTPRRPVNPSLPPHTVQPLQLHEGPLQLLLWGLDMIAMLSIYLGVTPIVKEACTLLRAGAYLGLHGVFMTLAQYTQLWGRVPDWALRVMTLVECVSHAQCGHMCPLVSPVIIHVCNAWGLPVVQWLFYQYWRQVVGKHTGHRAFSREAACSPHGKHA